MLTNLAWANEPATTDLVLASLWTDLVSSQALAVQLAAAPGRYRVHFFCHLFQWSILACAWASPAFAASPFRFVETQ